MGVTNFFLLNTGAMGDLCLCNKDINPLTFLVLVLNDIYLLYLWFACRYPCDHLSGPSSQNPSCQTAAFSVCCFRISKNFIRRLGLLQIQTLLTPFSFCPLFPSVFLRPKKWLSILVGAALRKYVFESLMIKIYYFSWSIDNYFSFFGLPYASVLVRKFNSSAAQFFFINKIYPFNLKSPLKIIWCIRICSWVIGYNLLTTK